MYSVILTVAHRAVVAATGLAVTIFGGRKLPPGDFGTLVICLAGVVAIQVLHSSFISEPMQIFGTKDYAGGLRRYLRMVLRASMTVSVAIAMLLAIAAGVLANIGNYKLAFSAIILAGYLACVLFSEVQERALYSQLRPGAALTSASACLGLLLLLLWAERQFMSLPSILAAIALANLLACFVSAFFLRNLAGDATMDAKKARWQHINYGRWIVLSQLLYFLLTQGNSFLIPSLLDLNAVAAFRSLSTIVGPPVQAFAALGMIVLPSLRKTSSPQEFRRVMLGFCTLVGAVGMLFTIVAGLFGSILVKLIFAGKFTLPLLAYWSSGIYAAAVGISFILGSALRALEIPKTAVTASTMAFIVSFPLQIYLIKALGSGGAMLAQAISCTLLASAMAVMLHRSRKIPLWNAIKTGQYPIIDEMEGQNII